MNNTVRVQIVQGMYKLLGNFAYFRLLQAAIVFKDLEKLALSKLCDHTEFV